jgi:hypothetical protein
MPPGTNRAKACISPRGETTTELSDIIIATVLTCGDVMLRLTFYQNCQQTRPSILPPMLNA